MVNVKTRLMRRWIAARARRRANPTLARSLSHLSDKEIDAGLVRARLSRTDLFKPHDAIAQHRVRMAHMLAALEIDADQAVASHWTELKHADGVCSRCTQAGRCRRWLEWDTHNEAPQVFCPNAPLFALFGADQANRDLGTHFC